MEDEIHHAIAFSQASPAAPYTIVKRLNIVGNIFHPLILKAPFC